MSQDYPIAATQNDLKELRHRIEALQAKIEAFSQTTNMSTASNHSSNTSVTICSPSSSPPLPTPTSCTKYPLHDSTILNGTHNFKAWQATMYTKLDEMGDADERTKIKYVLGRTSSAVYHKLMDVLPCLEDGGRYCCGSARQLVRNLAQYYDEDVRKVDLRFGYEGCERGKRA